MLRPRDASGASPHRPTPAPLRLLENRFERLIGITASGSAVGHLEFIEVTVTISHPRTGDLEILLDRGQGPLDVLAVPHGCARPGGVEQCSPTCWGRP